MTSNPRKRARSSSPGPSSHSYCVRDTEYYDEEGDCIIRVEKVLFKTHRVFLTRKSEVLADMFKLPQGDLPAEGTADENAIVLPGDKASQFRAFLRYTLASPLETQVDQVPIKAAVSVANLGHFANKYMMTGLVEWAVAVIQRLCQNPTPGPNGQFPAEFLRSALLLAKDAPIAAELWDLIPEVWKRHLKFIFSRLQYRDALDAAELVGHRAFLVDLYYLILSHRPHSWGMTALPPQQFTHRGLAPIHLQRLFAGTWSLTILWQQLANHRPKDQLPSNLMCSGHSKCVADWNKRWRDCTRSSDVDSLNPADIIGRITKAEKLFRTKYPTELSVSSSCVYKMMGLDNPFERVRKEVKDSLAQRFFDTIFPFVVLSHHLTIFILGTEGSALYAPLTS
ncbi:hypothetical protein FB45DRAFT_806404 [Roridomyces roridus]|uniref:BTB domain-containing protein n=1 Tax=Roridomyces roridus TaxID=1738132 RepID=A0AAD7B2Q8_9AGAR|nr:hypothetical protein FB45DRAFT_806404 [Roridomyces roridus]